MAIARCRSATAANPLAPANPTARLPVSTVRRVVAARRLRSINACVASVGPSFVTFCGSTRAPLSSVTLVPRHLDLLAGPAIGEPLLPFGRVIRPLLHLDVPSRRLQVWIGIEPPE